MPHENKRDNLQEYEVRKQVKSATGDITKDIQQVVITTTQYQSIPLDYESHKQSNLVRG